jgi:hypothetical protein
VDHNSATDGISVLDSKANFGVRWIGAPDQLITRIVDVVRILEAEA